MALIVFVFGAPSQKSDRFAATIAPCHSFLKCSAAACAENTQSTLSESNRPV
jgi:hypothetical protein